MNNHIKDKLDEYYGWAYDPFIAMKVTAYTIDPYMFLYCTVLSKKNFFTNFLLQKNNPTSIHALLVSTQNS